MRKHLLPLLLLACSNNAFALYGYDYIWEIGNWIGWSAVVENPEAGCRAGEHNSTYTYDERGLMKSRTDNKGNVTRFDYNERGLEVSRTEAFGTLQARTVTTERHPTLFLPTTITEPGRTTRYSYDVQGRLIGQTTTQR